MGHVSHLLGRLGLRPGEEAHLKLEVMLSSHQVKTLQNFASSEGDKVPPADIDQILSSYIKSVDTYEISPWLDTLKEQVSSVRDPLLVLFLLLALTYTLLMVLRCLRPFYMFLLVLSICISWHWLHMFKVAWAGKHARLLQSGEVPQECRPHEMTWMQTMQSSGRSLFSSVDRCEDYHKNIMVDPIYEVNPLMAFVDLSTNLVLHPLSSLGRNVGGMFTGLLENVPFFYRPFVLVAFLILVMFMMILISGYRISLPLFLGEIGPARSNNSSVEIQELKRLLVCSLEKNESERLLQHQVHQLVDQRKMSAPVTRLEYRSQVSGVEELQSQEEETTLSGPDGIIRGNIKIQKSIERDAEFVLTRSVSQMENLTTSIPENLTTRIPENMTTTVSEDTTTTHTNHQDSSIIRSVRMDEAASIPLPSTPLPRTPVKSLVVRGCSGSPRNTKFQWVNVDDHGDDVNNVEVKDEPVVEDKSDDFLNKVEEVFCKPTNLEVDC